MITALSLLFMGQAYSQTGENAHSRYFSEDAYKAANEPKELMIIPGAVHTDLYDRTDIIPFDKLEAFFKENLK